MKEKVMRITWEYPGDHVYTLHSIRSIVVYPYRVVISFTYQKSLELSTSCLRHIQRVEYYEEGSSC